MDLVLGLADVERSFGQLRREKKRGGTHHLLRREEEVGHCAGEVEQAFPPHPLITPHDLTDRLEEPQVLVDGHERDGDERPLVVGLVVLLEDGKHPSNLGAVDRDLGRNKRVERRLQTEQVKEGTSRVRVVAREGKERVLAMEKDDGVVVREKVLR